MQEVNAEFFDISRFVQPHELLFHDMMGVIIQSHATKSHLYITLKRTVLKIVKLKSTMHFKCNSVLCQGRMFTVVKLTENSKLGRLVEYRDFEFIFTNYIVNCEYNEVLAAQDGKLYYADDKNVLISLNPVTREQENCSVYVHNITNVFDRLVFTMNINNVSTLCSIVNNELQQVLPDVTMKSVFNNILCLRTGCNKQVVYMSLLDGQLAKINCTDKPSQEQNDYAKQQYFFMLQQTGSDDMQFNVAFYKEHNQLIQQFLKLDKKQIVSLVDELLVLGTKEALLIIEQFGIFNDEGNFVCFFKEDEFQISSNVVQYITSMIQVQLLISCFGFNYLMKQINVFEIPFQQLYKILHLLHPSQQLLLLDSIQTSKLKELLDACDAGSIDIFEVYYSQHVEKISISLSSLVPKLTLITSEFLLFHMINNVCEIFLQKDEKSDKHGMEENRCHIQDYITQFLNSKYTLDFQHQIYHTNQFVALLPYLIENLDSLSNEQLTNSVFDSIQQPNLLEFWNRKIKTLCDQAAFPKLKHIILWLRGMWRASPDRFLEAIKENVVKLFPVLQECDACFFFKSMQNDQFTMLITIFKNQQEQLQIGFFQNTEFSEQQIELLCESENAAANFTQLSQHQQASEELQMLQVRSIATLCFTKKHAKVSEKQALLKAVASTIAVLMKQANYQPVMDLVKMIKVQIYD